MRKFFNAMVSVIGGLVRSDVPVSELHEYPVAQSRVLSMKADVEAFMSVENFDEFAAQYMSLSRDPASVVREFMSAANGGRLERPHVFWHTENSLVLNLNSDLLRIDRNDAETHVFVYEHFADSTQGLMNPDVVGRKAHVSPFDEARALELGHSMKKHSDIVFTMIAFQDMVQAYFRKCSASTVFSAMDKRKSLKIYNVSKLNTFFGELMPFLLEVAENHTSMAFHDVVKHGVRNAFDRDFHESYKADYDFSRDETILDVVYKRCPFSDFILQTMSRGFRLEQGGVKALGAGSVGSTLEFLKDYRLTESIDNSDQFDWFILD